MILEVDENEEEQCGTVDNECKEHCEVICLDD